MYLLSCFGLFDGPSELVRKALYNALGYTNKWSHSFGPPWFVGMINDISSLGSRELVLVFSTLMYFYLKLSRGKTEAKNYLFTIGLGIVLILVTKSIIGMVGISRFVGSGHTVTEVIAGWSLGLAWYTFAQMFLKIDHKSIINK